MISEEEIEKAIYNFNFFNEGDYITREMSRSKEIVLDYIKEQGKIICDHDEIISRLEEDNTRKDKKIKELEADNYECNNIINDFIDERRELIEKLEEMSKEYNNEYRRVDKMIDENKAIPDTLQALACITEDVEEILSIVKR